MSQVNYFTYLEKESPSFCEHLKGHFETLIRKNPDLQSLKDLAGEKIVSCAFGPNALAFLTEDGRICRFKFNATTKYSEDRSTSPPEKKKNKSNDNKSTVTQTSTVASTFRPDPLEFLTAFGRYRSERTSAQSLFYPDLDIPPTIRSINSSLNRDSTSLEVPETLIDQVQSVLQGRSRAEIARELTRSYLDVSVAVNNLLNLEESNNSEDSVPTSDQVDEAIASITPLLSIGRTRPPPAPPAEPLKKSPIEAPFEDESVELLLYTLKWWPKNENTKFVQISAMYSDLLALDERGCLHQWLWKDETPMVFNQLDSSAIHFHSRARALGFSHEKVTMISSSFTRASVVLESNKIATWVDSSLWNVSPLESVMHVSDDVKDIPVKRVKCCDLFSVALLEDGSVWWWGILPASQRSKIMATSLEKSSPKIEHKKAKISPGQHVAHITSSLYQVGATAFYFDSNCLKMGSLLESITPGKSTARFQVLLSEAQSSKASKAKSKKRAKSRKRKAGEVEPVVNEEEWNLLNVVFLGEKTPSVGVVVKIDNENAIVHFGPFNNLESKKGIKDLLNQKILFKNIHVYGINELRVVRKNDGKVPSIPHLQQHPKKINISKNIDVISLSVTNSDLFIFTKRLKSSSFVIESISPGIKNNNLSSGKLTGYINKSLNNADVGFEDFEVRHNCALIKTKKYGTLILQRDYSHNYSMLSLPSLPQINDIFWSSRTVDDQEVFMVFTVSDPFSSSFSSPQQPLASCDTPNFYLNQNILHFCVYLAHMYELPPDDSPNLKSIISFIDDLLKQNSQEQKSLLLRRDFNGLTPFLYSLCLRSYGAANSIYNAILSHREDQSFVSDALFPSDLPYYLNPLYILCTNDCCSFLWTGNSHIQQDVYECRTCGITNTFCCCSECAFKCHKEHDCVIKTSSPTAFCDCWERCSCQSLFLGDQTLRKSLFALLISEEHLLKKIGTGTDHIMLYLIRTISRQNREHLRKKPLKKSEKSPPETSVDFEKTRKQRSFVIGHSIKHIKKPFKFAGFALKLILTIKDSVDSFFTSNTGKNEKESEETSPQYPPHVSELDSIFSLHSSGKMLDCFLYNMFSKCDKSFSRTLCTNLLTHYPEDEKMISDEISSNVLGKLIRSCVRIYVVTTSLMSPHLLIESTKTDFPTNDQFKLLRRIEFFFKQFPRTSVVEISRLSLSIITPVLSGFASQKSANFTLFSSMRDVNDFIGKFFNSIPGSSRTNLESKVKVRDRNIGDLVFVRNAANSEFYDTVDYDSDGGANPVDSGESDFDMYSAEDEYDLDDEIIDENDDDENDFDEDAEEELVEEEDEDASNFGVPQTTSRIRSAHDTAYSRHRDTASTLEEPRSENETNLNDSVALNESFSDEQANSNSRFQILSTVDHHRSSRHSENASLDPQHQWAVRVGNSLESLVRSDTVPSIRTANADALGVDYLGNTNVNTHCAFARSFAILLRLITDLCNRGNLFTTCNEDISNFLKRTFSSIFIWIFEILDSTENRLRFGISSLTDQVSSLQPGRWDYEILYSSNEDSQPGTGSSRKRPFYDRNLNPGDRMRNDFVSQALSLTRFSSNEHYGVLPYLDVSMLKHIAYIFDGFLYFFNFYNRTLFPEINYFFQNTTLDIESSETSSRGHVSFYARTKSTLCFGQNSPEFISTPVTQSLPLAVFPSLLKPTSTRKELFGIKDCTRHSSLDLPRINFFASMSLPSDELKNMINKIFSTSVNTFISRWKNIVDVFSQIFVESVGCEDHSILRESCQFKSKEIHFRSQIEKVRIRGQGEISFDFIERPREKLIVQTFKILNNYFSKHQPASKNTCSVSFNRVKAFFKGELGEGSGVTRNFLSVISQAIISPEKLPDLVSVPIPITTINEKNPHSLSAANRRLDSLRLGSGHSLGLVLERLRRVAERRQPQLLNMREPEFDSPVYELDTLPIENESSTILPTIEDPSTAENTSGTDEAGQNPNSVPTNNISCETEFELILASLKTRLNKSFHSDYHEYIVKNILRLPRDVIEKCLQDDSELLYRAGYFVMKFDLEVSFTNSQKLFDQYCNDHSKSFFPIDSALFFEPGKPGFYFPVNAKKSLARLNSYRNVGRIVGISLFCHETISINFCRPVLKFLLDRPLGFHDFAFYDPIQYESLRLLLLEAKNLGQDGKVDSDHHLHNLYFSVTVVGPNDTIHNVDIIENGSSLPVTLSNVYEYVQRYAEYHMLNSAKLELMAIKQGLLDVIHPNILHNLNSEDLRLILNGTGEISVEYLKSIVQFTDETGGESREKIALFKEWFWQLFDSLSAVQRCELLEFWTSSSNLSAMELTSKPTIILKAPSTHLPSSNTCIMRLYLPLYPSKVVLRSKVLMAIKTKTFGFV